MTDKKLTREEAVKAVLESEPKYTCVGRLHPSRVKSAIARLVGTLRGVAEALKVEKFEEWADELAKSKVVKPELMPAKVLLDLQRRLLPISEIEELEEFEKAAAAVVGELARSGRAPDADTLKRALMKPCGHDLRKVAATLRLDGTKQYFICPGCGRRGHMSPPDFGV